MNQFIHDEAVKLREAHGGYWEEHPDHPVQVWQDEASNDYTRLGYWEWCAARIDNESIESEDEE
jgi:hypothetical protein